MYPNIKRHSIAVTKVAFFLANRLNFPNQLISLEKVVKGALLHDIAKSRCITTGEDHCKLGREICEKHGLYEIADIVEEHVRLKEAPKNGLINEKHIVCYADKRVMHSKIVTLEERLEDIIRRYAQGRPDAQERILKNFEMAKDLERLIFEKIGIEPDLLSAKMSEAKELSIFDSLGANG